MKTMIARVAWTLLLATAAVPAADILPLADVRAGQKGIGRTVFEGSKVEEFGVEILGVMENIGPQQSVILARLSGGPLERTGVMQGMSGSPVYIDGKLIGAVAMGFELAKEPIAGIRPIEEMLRSQPAAVRRAASFDAGESQLRDLATPVSFTGFTAATLQHFGPRLRELGLNPQQGVSGGGRPDDAMGDVARLEPGSMISVQLLAGDMTMGADGTVTLVEDGRVYAFGHSLMNAGATEIPFARAEVIALLPNLQNSFKISQAKEWMGSITADRPAAITGIAGRRAQTTPLEIKTGDRTYRMSMVQDPVLTPLVAQMAVFSALDTAERSLGPATFTVRGQMQFQDGRSVKIDNIYSGDASVAASASAGVAAPLSYALASGFDAFKLNGMSLEIDVIDQRRQLRIADVIGPRYVRAGEDVELTVVLAGQNGEETTRQVRYHVPIGAPAQAYNFTVSDAAQRNMMEYSSAANATYRSADQVLGLLNGLASNTNAYLRVVRAGAAYSVEGRELQDPPPSVAMILQRANPAAASTVTQRGATVAEVPIPVGAAMVTGSQTIQIEVRP